nr:hypothetical protein [Stenomitos frigidus]
MPYPRAHTPWQTPAAASRRTRHGPTQSLPHCCHWVTRVERSTDFSIPLDSQDNRYRERSPSFRNVIAPLRIY